MLIFKTFYYIIDVLPWYVRYAIGFCIPIWVFIDFCKKEGKSLLYMINVIEFEFLSVLLFFMLTWPEPFEEFGFWFWNH